MTLRFPEQDLEAQSVFLYFSIIRFTMHDLGMMTRRVTVFKKFMYIPNRRQALLEVAAREEKEGDDWLGGEVDKIAENVMEIVEVRLAEEQRLREALAAVQADQLAILEEARLQIVVLIGQCGNVEAGGKYLQSHQEHVRG
eukprot:407046_1